VPAKNIHKIRQLSLRHLKTGIHDSCWIGNPGSDYAGKRSNAKPEPGEGKSHPSLRIMAPSRRRKSNRAGKLDLFGGVIRLPCGDVRRFVPPARKSAPTRISFDSRAFCRSGAAPVRFRKTSTCSGGRRDIDGGHRSPGPDNGPARLEETRIPVRTGCR